MENNYSPKSFWEKPEGKTGIVGLALGGAAGLYGLWKVLPYLITIAANTLHLMLLLAVIGVVLYMAFDPKVRTLISYIYKAIMRWITGVFIQIDPIGILKSYIEDLKENLRKMNKQIASLKGQMRKLKDIMKPNEKIINNNLL